MSTPSVMPAPTTTSSAATATGTAATSSAVWTMIRTIAASGLWGVTIKIGFGLVRKVAAALDGDGCSCSFGCRFTSAHFCPLLFEDGFARQPNAVAFDGQYFHQYLIALFQFIADVLDTVLGHFADVQQAVQSGKDFNEGAEISQARNLAKIGFPYFGGRGEITDNLQSFRGRSFVIGSDVDFARILHVDLHTGLLDDAANHFAARSDHVANLVHWNLKGINTRRKRRNFFPRSEEHTSELQSPDHLVCRLLLEKKKKKTTNDSKVRP